MAAACLFVPQAAPDVATSQLRLPFWRFLRCRHSNNICSFRSVHLGQAQCEPEVRSSFLSPIISRKPIYINLYLYK